MLNKLHGSLSHIQHCKALLSPSLHQHDLDTRWRLSCQVSRSAENNYTDLPISLFKSVIKHQKNPKGVHMAHTL